LITTLLDPAVLWALAFLAGAGIFFPYLLRFRRRRQEDRQRWIEARELGLDRPVAQYPFVDRNVCIGCGSCVKACPEGDVLGIVGGTAVVINGLRCVGHGYCARACPVGAIEVGLGELKGRHDLPVLTDELETTVPGVFAAGELTGLSLIANAVEQGQKVARAVAARLAQGRRPGAGEVWDLLIVGAGPAGLATALAAERLGIRALVLDQNRDLGGTVLHYPRRKMVLTRPVVLPSGRQLSRESYAKEELLELFQQEINAHRLRLAFGQRFQRLEPDDGLLRVLTSQTSYVGRFVVLALGRRGTPRRLGVPGEEQSKVMYQLQDAASFQGQRILVVGGGDSAVEAAVGLARQPGNQVWVSYRKNTFYRIKRKNLQAIERLQREGKVRVIFESTVERIERASVTLVVRDQKVTLPNDFVFVLIGGEPPYDLLRASGVRFFGDSQLLRRPPRLAAALSLLLALGLSPAWAAVKSPHGQLKIPCENCHTAEQWRPLRKDLLFRHEEVGMALEGAHAKVPCGACHGSLVFSRVAVACADCHRDVHRGEFGFACERCHGASSWRNREDFLHLHARSGFPLFSAHAQLACEACHRGSPPAAFTGPVNGCISCHETQFRQAKAPSHQGFSTDCARCHSDATLGWKAPNFRHERFPLHGVHGTLRCEQCHVGSGPLQTDCYSCHQAAFQGAVNPNHVAAGFPTTCETCHGTSGWRPASFDHGRTAFPLTGAHQQATCNSCHANGFAGTPKECYACHQSAYNSARNPNHATAGFPTTCQSCHSTNAWVPSTFNHDAQYFPIYSGKHRGKWSQCSQCHVAPNDFRTFECTTCHEHNQSKMDSEHKKVAGYRYDSRACYQCHPQGRK